MAEKILLGNEEWCSLPALGIPAIRARVDSGARTSALHASHIEPFQKEGVQWVSFKVHPIEGMPKTLIECEAEVSSRRSIKNTSGQSERRYVVKTQLKIGDQSIDIELSLADRTQMEYRMLLGREAMAGRMVVDPEESCLLGDKSEDDLNEIYASQVDSSKGYRIALLASNPNLYSNRRIIEAGMNRGHEMVFTNISHAQIHLNEEGAEVRNRSGEVFKKMDAVIPRIRPSLTFYGCAVTRQFESMGAYCLNSASSIAAARDKLGSLQILTEIGIETPKTAFANSALDTNDLIESVGGAPLVVKLLEGTQGMGVVLAETKKAAESVINAFKSAKTNILVQEFIKEAKGRDLRLFVIGGKVVGAMERVAPPGEFRANVHLGATISSVKITPKERKMALKSAKGLELDVAGVDIIRSENGPRLLEVNSSPGLEGIEYATGTDIAELMIIEIEKALAKRKKGRRK